MDQLERNQLAAALSQAGEFYGVENLSKDRIINFINVLVKFFDGKKLNDFLSAIDQYISDPKNRIFPSPAALRPYLTPKMDDDQIAVQAASKVQQAVTKFGWSNPIKAREFIGDLGWKAAMRFGPWSYICENLGTEISVTTFQAQIREISKSIINSAKYGIVDGPIAIPYKDPDALLNDRKRESALSLVEALSKQKELG